MPTTFRNITAADWRAQVEKDLAGASFDKMLVHRTDEGIAVQPLYTERPEGSAGVEVAQEPGFRICMRCEPAQIEEQLDGGADAIWLRADAAVEARALAKRTAIVIDTPSRGLQGAELLDGDTAPRALVSTLAYHDAGAGAADEIAFALSSAVALLRGGAGAAVLGAQVAVGRDTFVELAKLRALRVCWGKMLAAMEPSNATSSPLVVHAVCSSRTLTQRDPWVNMLRVTTQVFAAVLGGADVVTPASFDQALGAPSDLGRRVARNTGLVLREESHLGRVRDPASGSYYVETLTDALAREAWTRFRAIEREGGMALAVESGRIAARLEAAWHEIVDAVAKRRMPILGVSEFANLDEKLPLPLPARDGVATSANALPVHREAEPFERLRLRADALTPSPEAALVALGALAESRPRVGFAAGFFGAGGIRTHETTRDEPAVIACLCGSDERYAAEAVDRARALKAAGCKRLLLAGRPGPLEAALRDAGVDGFLFVGCDVVAVLSDLLDALR
jgi:methylmalonyl-CoA mutase